MFFLSLVILMVMHLYTLCEVIFCLVDFHSLLAAKMFFCDISVRKLSQRRAFPFGIAKLRNKAPSSFVTAHIWTGNMHMLRPTPLISFRETLSRPCGIQELGIVNLSNHIGSHSDIIHVQNAAVFFF